MPRSAPEPSTRRWLLYLTHTPRPTQAGWYVFTQVDASFATAISNAIGIVVIPEITLPGFEGIMYGAVTTYTNQASNMANAINNMLLAVWPSNTDNARLRACSIDGHDSGAATWSVDSYGEGDLRLSCGEVQEDMASLTLLATAIATCSLVFLPLLPSQKEHVRALAKRPRSRIAGYMMVALLVMLMVAGTVLAVLPIFEETACLQIVGGKGC